MRNGRAGAVRSAILAAQASTSCLLVCYRPLARVPKASPESRALGRYPLKRGPLVGRPAVRGSPVLEAARGGRVDDGPSRTHPSTPPPPRAPKESVAAAYRSLAYSSKPKLGEMYGAASAAALDGLQRRATAAMLLAYS